MNVVGHTEAEGFTWFRSLCKGVDEFVPTRRDLRESLEAYTLRVLDGLDRPSFAAACAELRPVWRREGLRLLHVPGYADADTDAGLCLVAPGVAVETAYVDWPDDLPAFDGSAP